MSIKLLFLIVISLLLSSCYTRYVYIYTDEPVDEVYIYDVNYVYSNLWYDDFYWRYNTGYYCDFGLYSYSPGYYPYSYYYKYKPYYKHRYKNRFNSRHTTRRLAGHLRGQNDPIGRGKAKQEIQRKYQMDDQKRMIIPINTDQVKPQKQRKFNSRTKTSDEPMTKWKRSNTSKKRTIVRQKQQNNSPKIRRSTPRNNSPKRSVPKRSNSVKSSTKKGRR